MHSALQRGLEIEALKAATDHLPTIHENTKGLADTLQLMLERLDRIEATLKNQPRDHNGPRR